MVIGNFDVLLANLLPLFTAMTMGEDWAPSAGSALLQRLRSGSPRLQGFAECDRMRHRFVQLVLVEFVFREADNDAGDTIANKVGERAAFGHEFINADQDGD